MKKVNTAQNTVKKAMNQIPFGIGVDLAEVTKIKRIFAKKERLTKIFTDGEINYCNRFKNKYERLAARFAVKEAVIKAFDDVSLGAKDIIVTNTESGRPCVEVLKYPKAKILVTITHTSRYSCAVVFLISKK